MWTLGLAILYATKLGEADVHERAGRFGSAFRAVEQALEASFRLDDKELQHAANERVKVLHGRASWMYLSVPVASADGVVVRQDGAIVPVADWQHSTAIDSGEHVWTVSLHGTVVFRREQRVHEGGSVHVLVDLPEPAGIAR